MNPDRIQQSHARPLSLLCMGDSITDGFLLSGGYRNTLCALLEQNGLAGRVRLIGPNCSGTGYSPFHAGFTGFAVEPIAEADSATGARDGILPLVPSVAARFPADVIFLMIGTNDILSRYDLPRFGERLRRLTDALLDAHAACKALCLATLPAIDGAVCPYVNPQCYPADAVDRAVADCNAQITALAAAYRAAGRPVRLADIHGALTKDDLQDGVHPSAAGYEKIGRFWFRLLTALPAFSAI